MAAAECEPTNPGGNMGFGACIMKDDVSIWMHSDFITAGPHNSNNVAEYIALQRALKYLIENNLQNEPIEVYGDSMIAIMQMKGKWKIRSGFYVPYAKHCRSLLPNFKNIKFEWIPREKNSICDELSKRKLIENHVEFRIQPL